MKKVNLTLVTLGVLLLPVIAFAQIVGVQPVGIPAVTNGLQGIVTAIENAAATVFGAIAVICFIVAGILFLTAGGVPEKVQAARSAFIWGIAGVVVGIIAFSIVSIVASFIH